MGNARPTGERRAGVSPESGGAGFLDAIREWWQSLWTTPHQVQPRLSTDRWEDLQ